MTYTTVLSGLKNIIGKIGLAESKSAFDFENSSVNEYGNTFILVCLSGENDEKTSETLSNRIYDIQEWEVQVAVKKSSGGSIASRDELLRIKDNLINKIDNPANNTFTRLIKYNNWEISEQVDYFLLRLRIKVVDTIVYS